MTLAEIARLAGVSRTTASYVINGRAREQRIRQATVERVMAVVEQHHYRVDAQAAALRRGTSRTLGLIIPDLENASYARLAKLLERGAREHGYQMLIVGSDDEPASERGLAHSLRAQRCEALIVASCLGMDAPFYAEIMAEGVPVIGIDRSLDPRRFVSVVSNNRAAACALTQSALSPEVARIAWFDAVPHLSVSVERRAGFLDAVESTDVLFSTHSAQRYDRAEGARLMRELLACERLPDALVTASYTLLDGVLDVLMEYGALPELLRLATFGDDRLLDFLPVAVNSLPQDHVRIAERTLERALAACQGDYTPGQDVIERRLRHRLPSNLQMA
ncbi:MULTISPECIES: catabolite repressor/activator [Halomonadaceae]|uniref:catabolite repressor/activator n=1 Tax=Halomonadaceae TaxID=28256 RepID=UPI001599783C|nr:MULTISPECIES: catabolite repressor/activator [Halomonas]QJQ95837.1 catabolite repressor/activator [Halomonas sp. PA5]